MNVVVISGFVAGEPIIYSPENGAQYIVYSVYVKCTERQCESDVFDVVTRGVAARYVMQHVRKGDYVIVRGTLTHDSTGRTSDDVSITAYSQEVRHNLKKRDGESIPDPPEYIEGVADTEDESMRIDDIPVYDD